MPNINELQLAKELIKFPSVTPTDAGVMKFLEKKLKTLGFKTKILEFKEKITNLLKFICKTWEYRTKLLLCWTFRCGASWYIN